jgi:hypothetical protein
MSMTMTVASELISPEVDDMPAEEITAIMSPYAI